MWTWVWGTLGWWSVGRGNTYGEKSSMGRRWSGGGGVGWGVVGELCVDGMDISHPLAEMAVHYGGYAGTDGLACLLDDYGCGRF